MSYQVLARKWRPQKFSEVVGQHYLLTALANGLAQNRLHHAYLFSGTRGVGKTSIARLVAKGLNCAKGVTSEPCGECENCRAIEQGNFIDLLEIDAASKTKVEDTRELLDNVQYKPVRGRYKIYLIDEIHMLSRYSFNALLKTLEEPPEYVKFLLATTDPQKLPITILSRCIQFHLKALEASQIKQHLVFVLSQEKIAFEDHALDKLAKAANGSIRDSLSLTDQAIVISNSNISLDIVNKMLGLIDENQALEIVHALQQANGEALMNAVKAVSDKGGDWDQLLVEVGEILHNIAMQQMSLPKDVNADNPLSLMAKAMLPEDVQFYYQIIVNGRNELAFAPNPRIGAEMVLLRALAFHPKAFSQPTTINQEDRAPQISSPQQTSSPQLKSIELQENNLKQEMKTKNHVLNQDDSSEKLLDLPVIDTNVSPALAVLKAKQQLKQHNQQIQHDGKKKDSFSLVKANARINENVNNDTRENKNNPQVDVLPVTNLAPLTSKPEQEQFAADSEPPNIDYQWQWSNSDYIDEEKNATSTEIKQDVLAKNNPELDAKILLLSQSRDPWAKLAGQLALSGLANVVVMNSVLLEQTAHFIKLGLRSQHVHLLNSVQKTIQQAITNHFQSDIDLIFEKNDDPLCLTPMDYRGLIYQELMDSARQGLENDPNVQLLKQEFDAELDMQNIVPVA